MAISKDTVTITITIPKSQIHKMNPILKLAVPGYAVNMQVNHEVAKTRDDTKIKRGKDIVRLRLIASELGVLEKTNRQEVIVLRTALVYFLRKDFSGPLIAEVFDWDSSNVIACVKRYDALKHYPDYAQASSTVIQYLKLYLPVDSLQGKP